MAKAYWVVCYRNIKDADKLAAKLWGVRIFDDADGVMNRSHCSNSAKCVMVQSQ